MSRLIDKVVNILSEEIGSLVAQSSVRMYLKQIGVDEESAKPEHLPWLADQLRPGLCVFVGSNKAADLAKRIREIKVVK